MGDFDANDTLEAIDIDMLTDRMLGRGKLSWLDDMFDLNRDSNVDQKDHQVWIKSLKHSWYGDANFDGAFNTSDFLQVFEAGKYEKGWLDAWGSLQGELASWSEGDWNGDGVFDTGDFVIAFEDGGYEQGPRSDVVAVPEPGSAVLFMLGLLLTRETRFRRRLRLLQEASFF